MKKIYLFIIAFIVLAYILFERYKERAPIPQKPFLSSIGPAGVPVNPHIYFGPHGVPFENIEAHSGYGGNSSIYMPLFGFVGYSMTGTE